MLLPVGIGVLLSVIASVVWLVTVEETIEPATSVIEFVGIVLPSDVKFGGGV